jgi:hypothetical protein
VVEGKIKGTVDVLIIFKLDRDKDSGTDSLFESDPRSGRSQNK